MFTLDQVLASLGCSYQLVGDRYEKIEGFAPISIAGKNDLCFLNQEDSRSSMLLQNTKSKIILCRNNESFFQSRGERLLIFVKNPRLCFARVVRALSFPECSEGQAFVHPTALVSEQAKLGSGVYIGPYVSIGAAVIGHNVRIEHHSRVHDNVSIGNSVLISEFCNIGGNGFGFVRNDNAEYEYFPHLGSVVIEDSVSVFPYVNIDRGTLAETRVGRGTKIDHYCHIGHNSRIGMNNLITPNVTTLGGVVIGDRCVIGCGSIFRENVKVGDDVTIGMGSSVTKDVPPGETWAGVPAREFDQFKKINSKLLELIVKS